MEGKIFSYIHFNGQVGSMVKISTETDFASRTDEIKDFGKDIAMQVAMNNPANVAELLEETFIKDGILIGDRRTINHLLENIINTIGENVEIVEFKRFSVK